MRFSPHTAARRFGYGLSPAVAAPVSAEQMLAALGGPDVAAAQYPMPKFRVLQDALVLQGRFRRFARDNPTTDKGKEAREKSQKILREMRGNATSWFVQQQQRRIHTDDAFRERLVAFWADHFTALGKGGLLRVAAPLYVEDAIRPKVTGRFADLLMASVTHPLMLHYLDQTSSVGPNSRVAQRRRERSLGLNENLAREVLELHTLGVGGPYTQSDVHELAKLLTGMAVSRDYTFKFRPAFVEPGQETVLGQTYAEKGGMVPIRAALDDLARHPATARHIARKLVVHFVADAAPPAIVAAVEAAYLRTDGNLMACYEALLSHSETWGTPATNICPPDAFLSAVLRALAPPLSALKPRQVRRLFLQPLRLMGQPWMQPGGPDGFAEEDTAWVTPQGISARLEWAMDAPARMMDTLPDPRDFVTTALGKDVPPAVVFAASAAEDRQAAIGLILASPAFQRR